MDETDPTISDPVQFRGMKYTDYVNNIVNWTAELRASVQSELSSSGGGLHLPFCQYDNDNDEQQQQESEQIPLGETPLVIYPPIHEPYRPIHVCNYTGQKTSSKAVNFSGGEVSIFH
jgi:hypothetical protein